MSQYLIDLIQRDVPRKCRSLRTERASTVGAALERSSAAIVPVHLADVIGAHDVFYVLAVDVTAARSIATARWRAACGYAFPA